MLTFTFTTFRSIPKMTEMTFNLHFILRQVKNKSDVIFIKASNVNHCTFGKGYSELDQNSRFIHVNLNGFYRAELHRGTARVCSSWSPMSASSVFPFPLLSAGLVYSVALGFSTSVSSRCCSCYSWGTRLTLKVEELLRQSKH